LVFGFANMANRCAHCGKGKTIGRSHRHHRGVAGKRWLQRAPVTRKVFKPNLQSVKMKVNGKTKKIKLCTKCLKAFKKKQALL